jgi:cytochrome c oxidase subunit 2
VTSRRPHRRGKRLALTALSLVVLATACEGTAQNTLAPHGHFSSITYSLIWKVFVVAVVVFVLVEGLIVYEIIRFRAKSPDDRPEQIHGSTKLEITWAIIPLLILLVVGFATIGQLFQLDREQPNPVRIDVIGHQWWWEYRYHDPGDDAKIAVVTANELHIPVGRNIRLNLESVDVIHNFWPPKLAGKIYAIPGRQNKLYIKANDPAVYYGECAEYCGLSHANMRLRVVAETQTDFDTWMQRQSVAVVPPVPDKTTQAAAYAGAQAFLQKGCSGCHTVSGYSAGNVGPNLTDFNTRSCFAGCIFANNDPNLRLWLRDPPGEKPGAKMPNLKLTEQDITNLTAYLRTLGDASTQPTNTGPAGS